VIPYVNFILTAAIALNLYIVSSSRLRSCVQAAALQGSVLAFLPILLWGTQASKLEIINLLLIGIGTLGVKALLIPFLMFRSIQEANVRREVEPFISLHLSLSAAAVLVIISFWISKVTGLPHPPSAYLVPAAFSGILIGFLIMVSRQKAITQVIGYLIFENGIFIFGQILFQKIPLAVELGVLLDLLVGILVMGIAIYHISREFDHIDVSRLDGLKG
jgi:hydrogenase-4 component E